MIHELKSWPEPFQAVASGRKTHEIRIDDRPYEAGDVLRLREWVPSDWAGPMPRQWGYTGLEVYVAVTYVSRPYECEYAFTSSTPRGRACIMSIRVMTPDEIGLELGVDKVRQDQEQRNEPLRALIAGRHPACLSDCTAAGCCGGCRT